MSTTTTSPPPPTTTGNDDRRRWAALYVLCAGMLMIVLDATIVNVALPSIQEDLAFTQSGLAWVVNAYLIAFGGLLLLAGRLGDLRSRRDLFLGGLGVFTAASLACGVARSQEVLVAARFVQGVGGAMTSAVILGMIVTMFPEPREQAKAIGVYGFVASAGGSIGLFLGGVITEAISWHWIFFVNLPVGAATALLARRLVDRDNGLGLRQGADAPGAVLLTAGLMLAVYTIVDPAAERGWAATETLVLGGLSLAILTAFVVREATAATPLIPLRIFASRNVSGANAIQCLVVAGMFAMGFLGVLYLQRVQGYDALQTGLAYVPMTVTMGFLSLRFSERLVTRVGPRAVLIPTLLISAVGLGLFARAPVHGSYLVDVLPSMLLLAVGMGCSFPAIMTLAMSGATPSDAGLASGLVNTTMQVGGALGLAVLATLATTRTDDALAAGDPTDVALVHGYRLAFVIAALLVLAAAVVAAVVLRPVPAGGTAPMAMADADDAPAEPELAYAEV